MINKISFVHYFLLILFIFFILLILIKNYNVNKINNTKIEKYTNSENYFNIDTIINQFTPRINNSKNKDTCEEKCNQKKNEDNLSTDALNLLRGYTSNHRNRVKTKLKKFTHNEIDYYGVSETACYDKNDDFDNWCRFNYVPTNEEPIPSGYSINNIGILATVKDYEHIIISIIIPKEHTIEKKEKEIYNSIKEDTEIYIEVLGKKNELNERQINVIGRLVDQNTLSSVNLNKKVKNKIYLKTDISDTDSNKDDSDDDYDENDDIENEDNYDVNDNEYDINEEDGDASGDERNGEIESEPDEEIDDITEDELDEEDESEYVEHDDDDK